MSASPQLALPQLTRVDGSDSAVFSPSTRLKGALFASVLAASASGRPSAGALPAPVFAESPSHFRRRSEGSILMRLRPFARWRGVARAAIRLVVLFRFVRSTSLLPDEIKRIWGTYQRSSSAVESAMATPLKSNGQDRASSIDGQGALGLPRNAADLLDLLDKLHICVTEDQLNSTLRRCRSLKHLSLPSTVVVEDVSTTPTNAREGAAQRATRRSTFGNVSTKTVRKVSEVSPSSPSRARRSVATVDIAEAKQQPEMSTSCRPDGGEDPAARTTPGAYVQWHDIVTLAATFKRRSLGRGPRRVPESAGCTVHIEDDDLTYFWSPFTGPRGEDTLLGHRLASTSALPLPQRRAIEIAQLRRRISSSDVAYLHSTGNSFPTSSNETSECPTPLAAAGLPRIVETDQRAGTSAVANPAVVSLRRARASLLDVGLDPATALPFEDSAPDVPTEVFLSWLGSPAPTVKHTLDAASVANRKRGDMLPAHDPVSEVGEPTGRGLTSNGDVLLASDSDANLTLAPDGEDLGGSVDFFGLKDEAEKSTEVANPYGSDLKLKKDADAADAAVTLLDDDDASEDGSQRDDASREGAHAVKLLIRAFRQELHQVAESGANLPLPAPFVQRFTYGRHHRTVSETPANHAVIERLFPGKVHGARYALNEVIDRIDQHQESLRRARYQMAHAPNSIVSFAGSSPLTKYTQIENVAQSPPKPQRKHTPHKDTPQPFGFTQTTTPEAKPRRHGVDSRWSNASALTPPPPSTQNVRRRLPFALPTVPHPCPHVARTPVETLSATPSFVSNSNADRLSVLRKYQDDANGARQRAIGPGALLLRGPIAEAANAALQRIKAASRDQQTGGGSDPIATTPAPRAPAARGGERKTNRGGGAPSWDWEGQQRQHLSMPMKAPSNPPPGFEGATTVVAAGVRQGTQPGVPDASLRNDRARSSTWQSSGIAAVSSRSMLPPRAQITPSKVAVPLPTTVPTASERGLQDSTEEFDRRSSASLRPSSRESNRIDRQSMMY